MSHLKTFLAVTIILLIAGIFIFEKIYFAAPSGYQKVSDYNALQPGHATCLAAMPQCGYCPGIIKHDFCYIKKQQ